MRIFLMTSFFLLFALAVNAQSDTSGMAIYRLHYDTDTPDKDRFDTLYFNRGQYLYISKWAGGQYTDSRGITIDRFPKNKRYYYPTSLATRVELAQDYRKKKIVYQKDDLEPITWKFHDKFKEINGIKAQKATATSMPYSEAKTIIAWFATDIPVPVGPGGLFGLPGLIVKGLIYPDYHHKWTLEKIVYEPVTIPVPNPDDYVVEAKSKNQKRKKKADRSKLSDALKETH